MWSWVLDVILLTISVRYTLPCGKWVVNQPQELSMNFYYPSNNNISYFRRDSILFSGYLKEVQVDREGVDGWALFLGIIAV